MKRIFACILAVLYFTASSGMVVNMHYCMGKLASIEVENFSPKACMCGPKETKKGCCGTETKVLKVDNVHQASLADFSVKPPVFVTNNTIQNVELTWHDHQIAFHFSHAPPLLLSKPSIHILNCVFTI